VTGALWQVTKLIRSGRCYDVEPREARHLASVRATTFTTIKITAAASHSAVSPPTDAGSRNGRTRCGPPLSWWWTAILCCEETAWKT
jgi:type VI protein secretion system component VasF